MSRYRIFLSLFLIISLVIYSCQDDDSSDTTPPGKLVVDLVTPTHGGGIIDYTLPNDNDILFVRAEYTNSLGVDVYRVSSSHNSVIEIDGLNQTSPLNVRLYVVDESGNMSEVPDNSVFIQFLIKRLEENTNRYLTSEQLFSKLKIAVINNSINSQIPQFGIINGTGDEGGGFLFIKKD